MWNFFLLLTHHCRDVIGCRTGNGSPPEAASQWVMVCYGTGVRGIRLGLADQLIYFTPSIIPLNLKISTSIIIQSLNVKRNASDSSHCCNIGYLWI